MDLLVRILIRILEGLFILGVLGSAVVWFLTTVDDVENMFSRDTGAEEGSITGDTHHHDYSGA